MKKIHSLVLAIFMIISCAAVTSCGVKEKSDGKSVVCTIAPVYDWVKNVIGDDDGYSVTLLIKNKTDMHSYQPTVADMATISQSDVFVYVGGESDAWVDDALKSVGGDTKAISLLELLGDKAKDEEHIDDEDDDHDHDHAESEKDEHVWLSLKNAAYLCDKLADEFSAVFTENNFKANSAAYIAKLNELDGEYADAVANAEYDTLLFGDRFPFLYLVSDYGLNYYAAFSGCSAETEASFATITKLAQKVDELNLPAIIKIDGSTHKIAETIRDNTSAKNQEIITVDSMQSTTLEELQNGKNYLSVMRDNLSVFKTALGGRTL